MMDLHLCDVFAERPLGGNSLSVVVHDRTLSVAFMQSLTQELRQFETAFVRRSEDGGYDVRVFDLTRELAFAGHPLLGAAVTMHHADAREEERCAIHLSLSGRKLVVRTSRVEPGVYRAELDAGPLQRWSPCTRDQTERALAAFSLHTEELHDSLGCVVASTGLRYLIVPVAGGLDAAEIVHPALSELLQEVDAEFAYLLDVHAREGRHWENDGSLEDIATGSAAGVAGAFLVRHGLAGPGEQIVLRQGRFVGRPSALHVTVDGPAEDPAGITVAGPVALVARGTFEATAC